MAKDKDKKPNEIYPAVDISYSNLTRLPLEYKDSIVASFDCSGNELRNLSNCPKEVKGDFICKDNKVGLKIDQFDLGAGRFEKYGGDEDDNTNRPVKVGGSFITDENVYKSPKIYDINVGVKSEKESDLEKAEELPEGQEVVAGDYVEFGNVKMVLNIIRPILGFELTGYRSWGNGKPTHGFFLQRLGYKGPHKSGVEIGYGGAPPPEGYNGWGDPDKYFKNFINWSYFESKRGSGQGSESQYQWGASQVGGVTVYDGKQYGAKTHSRTYAPTYYYLKGDNNMKRTTGGKIFQAKEGRTIELQLDDKGKPVIADFFENIQVALTGAGSIILDGKSKSPGLGYGGKHPFFGKLDDGTYFAGGAYDMYSLGDRLINFFKKRGKKVEWADCGDGGGSTQLFVNGVDKWVKSEKDNRPVAAVIAW